MLDTTFFVVARFQGNYNVELGSTLAKECIICPYCTDFMTTFPGLSGCVLLRNYYMVVVVFFFFSICHSSSSSLKSLHDLGIINFYLP